MLCHFPPIFCDHHFIKKEGLAKELDLRKFGAIAHWPAPVNESSAKLLYVTRILSNQEVKMNRSVNLFRLFRNISSPLFILVFCLIAQPFEGAQSTDVQIFPESMNIVGTFMSGTPVTFTADTAEQSGNTLYYKFFYCANYGTPVYESSPWVVMQEYSITNSCTYTFPQDGSYIVVARVVADPNNEPVDLPIIGGVVTIGNGNSVHITSLSAGDSGAVNPGKPITYTANASSPSGGALYYKWFYCANYGTSAYATSPWVVVQDYSTDNSCDYTFPSAGSYVIVVRAVTDPNNEPADLPIIGATAICNNQDADWEQCADLNTARDQFAAGVIGDNLYVFGGNGSPDGLNLSSLEIYNTNTGVWSFGPSNAMGVEEISGAVLDGVFFVFGAYGGGSPYGVFNFAEKFVPNTGQWTSLAPKPTTVAVAPVAVYNGEIFVFGGYYGNDLMDTGFHYSVVEAYNPATNSWRTVTHMPKSYEQFAVSVYQDRAYLIGGFDNQNGQRVAQFDVISYHFPSSTWTTSNLGTLSSVRGFSYSNPAPVVNGKIYLVGGGGLIDPNGPISEDNAQPLADVLIYDIASGVFAQGPSMPEQRDSHAVLLHDGYLYAIGGETSWNDSDSIRTADVHRLLVDDIHADD
ncbi:MAG: kelch repeat-containing protein [Pseudomonadota bacterium]